MASQGMPPMLVQWIGWGEVNLEQAAGLGVLGSNGDNDGDIHVAHGPIRKSGWDWGCGSCGRGCYFRLMSRGIPAISVYWGTPPSTFFDS